MAQRHHQTEDDIKAFKGLEAVRKRPAMYIGQGGSHGIFTILREAMDNSVDEFLANDANDKMTIQVFDTGYLAVHDNGQGIPVGKHKTEKISTLQVAVGMLHAGGKLHANAYKHSRGTHGVGVAVTNALSSHFQVFTCRDGTWWTAEYERGKLVAAASKTSLKAIRKQIDPIYKKGTIILFKPDKEIFGKQAKLSTNLVCKWAKTTAYLSGGFSVTIQSDDVDDEYLYERGILDWLDDSLKELDCSVITEDPIEIKTQHMDACLTFTDAQGNNNLKGYCNGLEQVDGGDHVSTTLSALYASLKAVANAKDSFTRDDVAEGLLGIVNFQIDQPQFSSQTKEKLTDPRFAQLCKDDLTKALKEYWGSHKTLAGEICRRASLMRSAKVDFLSQKKALTSLKKNKNNLLKMPGKLAAAPRLQTGRTGAFPCGRRLGWRHGFAGADGRTVQVAGNSVPARQGAERIQDAAGEGACERGGSQHTDGDRLRTVGEGSDAKFAGWQGGSLVGPGPGRAPHRLASAGAACRIRAGIVRQGNRVPVAQSEVHDDGRQEAILRHVG